MNFKCSLFLKKQPPNQPNPQVPKRKRRRKEMGPQRGFINHIAIDLVPAFSPPGKVQHHNGAAGPRVQADRMQLTWRRCALSGTYNTCSVPALASLSRPCQKINKPDQTCHGLEVFSSPFILIWCAWSGFPAFNALA